MVGLLRLGHRTSLAALALRGSRSFCRGSVFVGSRCAAVRGLSRAAHPGPGRAGILSARTARALGTGLQEGPWCLDDMGKRLAEDDLRGDPKRKSSNKKPRCDKQRWVSLKSGSVGDGPIVYWCSRDQRVLDNWALLHCLDVAESHGASVAVVFNLAPEWLTLGARQCGFMLRGLREMERTLRQYNIALHLTTGVPEEQIPQFVADKGAGLLVTDFNPLRESRKAVEAVADALGSVPFREVDAHNVVPMWVASDKQEYGARTIRRKIHAQLPNFLRKLPEMSKCETGNAEEAEYVDWDKHIAACIEKGAAVPEVTWCPPGEEAALKALHGFLTRSRLGKFGDKRNDPNVPGALSGLSPYLHFGQISAHRCAMEAIKAKKETPSLAKAVDSFLEELVIRRELTDNFCYYNAKYDEVEGAYAWAKDSLALHANDRREYTYTREEFERGKTHDHLWNAAQHELFHFGKMHGFMRMYWAKKILEWSPSPEDALANAIYLNDTYSLDGRDPNGYVGCMWSICGIHDQGWAERPVFGKIRFMNYNGCKRKFDVDAYVQRIRRQVRNGKNFNE